MSITHSREHAARYGQIVRIAAKARQLPEGTLTTQTRLRLIDLMASGRGLDTVSTTALIRSIRRTASTLDRNQLIPTERAARREIRHAAAIFADAG